MAEYKDVTYIKKQIADCKRAIQSSHSDYLTGYVCALSATEGVIAEAPTADVVGIVHGEWTYKTNSNERLGGTDATYDYECSVCNELALEESNYCPNCGAKMDGFRSYLKGESI